MVYKKCNKIDQAPPLIMVSPAKDINDDDISTLLTEILKEELAEYETSADKQKLAALISKKRSSELLRDARKKQQQLLKKTICRLLKKEQPSPKYKNNVG